MTHISNDKGRSYKCITRVLGIGSIVLLVSGCSLSDITDVDPSREGASVPSDILESFDGAKLVYMGAVAKFAHYLISETIAVAKFTDEVSLQSAYERTGYDDRIGRKLGASFGHVISDEPYSRAQQAKIQTEQALQLLKKYGADHADNMKAHANAIIGFIHLMLADNYCSGIPLSTSLYGGEYISGNGYPTDSLYSRAINYFDSGLILNPDSSAIKAMLLIGKARALNTIGNYRDAFHVAAQVTESDSAYVSYQGMVLDLGQGRDTAKYTVLNNKGLNGLHWITDISSNQDSRIKINYTSMGDYTLPIRNSVFSNSLNHSLKIASWDEAKLIEAEYYLNMDDIPNWLKSINEVRRKYTTRDGTPLADTTDPGDPVSRVNLLFRERAYSNYTTARRLGDLRSLIRRYHRLPHEVFPTGAAEGLGFVMYGENYVFVPEVPRDGREETYNRNYIGCLSYEP